MFRRSEIKLEAWLYFRPPPFADGACPSVAFILGALPVVISAVWKGGDREKKQQPKTEKKGRRAGIRPF